MDEGFWKLLEKFTPEAHQEALRVCDENEFDKESWDVSLNESYLNLLSCCTVLKGVIEQNYFQKLPLTIQKEIEGLVAKIASDHDELLAGQDKVDELAETIESLYTAIWRYRLNQVSGEEIGYAYKLDQLKQIEVLVSEKLALIETALASRKKLDQLLADFATHNEAIQEQLKAATDASNQCVHKLAEVEENGQMAATATQLINQHKDTSDDDLESIQESKKLASEDQEVISKMVSEFTNLTTELAKNKKAQQEIFAEFENYRKKIDGLLADANRTGLAASFTNRRLWLLAPLAGWLVVFAFSIFGLWYIGREHIAPILEGNKPILWEQLPLRLALTAPLSLTFP
jgi:DNA repair exonuclease SbcCD ATPase subunit